MVDRVRIRGGQLASLQVSLPGFDVNTATLEQMAFDARFANMTLVTKGIVFCPWETTTYVYFPTVLPRIPRVFAGFRNGVGATASTNFIDTPNSVLTSNAGTFLYLQQLNVNQEALWMYPATFAQGSEATIIRSYASGYLFYNVYI